MGFSGIDIREEGDRILIRSLLLDESADKVVSGTASLYLYEVQEDGALKGFDFDDNTFKTGELTTETGALTHQTANDGATNTGIWTYVITNVDGFTSGGVYIAMVHHGDASPAWQAREFQYGDGGVTEKLNRILGLSKENMYMDNIVNSGGKMTSARIRLFSSAPFDVDSDTPLATYTVTITYSNGQMATWKMEKQ